MKRCSVFLILFFFNSTSFGGTFVPDWCVDAFHRAMTLFISKDETSIQRDIPRLPHSLERQVISQEPWIWGGFIYKIQFKQGDNQLILVEQFVKKYPRSSAQYGYAIKFENSIEMLFYPNKDALNGTIQRLYKIGAKSAPTMIFRSVDGLISEDELIDFLSQRIFVIAKDGDTHFHDIGIHVNPYRLLPKEIVDRIQAEALLIKRLKNSASLMKHADFKFYLDNLKNAFLANLEVRSANIAHSFIEENSEEKLANALTSLGYAYSNFRIYLGDGTRIGWSLQDKMRLAVILATSPNLAPLEESKSLDLARDLFAKLKEVNMSQDQAWVD